MYNVTAAGDSSVSSKNIKGTGSLKVAKTTNMLLVSYYMVLFGRLLSCWRIPKISKQ
jgi:hypothetical protein